MPFDLVALPGVLLAAEVPKPPELTLIKAAHFIDPATGRVKNDQAVLFKGEKIKAVGAAADLSASLPPGPRMLCGGVPLSATGGHDDLNGMLPTLPIDTVASTPTNVFFMVKDGVLYQNALTADPVAHEE